MTRSKPAARHAVHLPAPPHTHQRLGARFPTRLRRAADPIATLGAGFEAFRVGPVIIPTMKTGVTPVNDVGKVSL
eukprot:2567914-Rhodomonas_salina.1